MSDSVGPRHKERLALTQRRARQRERLAPTQSRGLTVFVSGPSALSVMALLCVGPQTRHRARSALGSIDTESAGPRHRERAAPRHKQCGCRGLCRGAAVPVSHPGSLCPALSGGPLCRAPDPDTDSAGARHRECGPTRHRERRAPRALRFAESADPDVESARPRHRERP